MCQIIRRYDIDQFNWNCFSLKSVANFRNLQGGMMRKILGVGILLLGLPVLARTATAQTPKGDVNAGKAKFQMFCASCHGATGKGDGAAAAALNPKPRNFQDTATMGKKTDAHLKKVIQQGGTAVGLSALMPPWGSSLSEQDLANVIAYIRSLGKK